MPFHLTDTQWIMIVLAAIYLFECACWVRREAICLGTVLGRFRELPSPSFLGNEQNKLIVGNPSPLARCFLCEPWPIILSPQGIIIPEGVLVSTEGEPCSHLAFDSAAFETGAAATAVEKEVHLLGVSIAQCASREQAEQIAAMIREIQEAEGANQADRGRIIGEHLDRWTDNAAVGERFSDLKTLAGPLRTSAFALFVLAFICGPILYSLPWQLNWRGAICYFAMVLTIWMLTVWDYSVCRKRLLGESFSVRFRHVGMLLLSPASAMRSPEVLLRHSLGGFHPLAAAAALCDKDRVAAIARPMLLALEHPKPTEIPGNAEARSIDAWFRKTLLKRLNSLLGRLEIDPLEFLRPAAPLADSRSYCPRCHNQYVLATGTCPDCGGLALVAYPGKL